MNQVNQGLSHQQRIAHHVDMAFRPPDAQPKRAAVGLFAKQRDDRVEQSTDIHFGRGREDIPGFYFAEIEQRVEH